MILCRHCRCENEDGSRFCDSCGGDLAAVCPSCAASVRATARFCSQCGHKLAPADTPPPVAEEGARKHVTILFADVRGSTQLMDRLDPEAAMQLLDPAIEAMCRAVAQSGGMVNRIEGDGVMALFGAPLACEDHALRACLAAREVLAQVMQVDPALAIRVGVASGDVVIRQIGRGPSDWDAVGITPHLARRMEQLASPGAVLIAGSTAQLVRGFTEVAALGPIEVKGMTRPVEVFELLAATARPTWEVRAAAAALNRFVGRTAELVQLTAAATRASFGRGRVVSVIGEAGVGKSRLMHEFLRTLPAGAWHVLRVAAVSHAAQAAYHLAGGLLRAWLGVEAADERAQIERKLDQAMALHGEAIESLPLRALLELPIADAAWHGLELPVRRGRVLAALRLAVLREAARQPLVLLVEDLHWADPPSLALLEAIVEGLGAARLLVVVTTRPGEGQKPSWSSRSYSSELYLNPLTPDEADALLGELLGPGEALAGLRRQIIERTEGTPLFLEEVARSVTERGLIESFAPRLVGAEFEIPGSVQAVLAERLDRLPPERRRVLQLAAVIGKDIPFALLRAMSDLPEARLAEELAELQAAEFLYELHLPAGMEYTFKHALTQAVTYEAMLRRYRRDLHARALTAMAALYADRLEEMPERLAEHALKGEVWPEAFAYSLRAGRRASRNWAWHEAVAYLEQASAVLARLPSTAENIERAIEVRLDLRVALAATGDFPRIRQCLGEAHELAARSGNDLRLAQVGTSRCIAHSLLGDLDEAVAAGRLALDTAIGLEVPASTLNAVFALGQAHWYRGEVAEAERVLAQGLPHVRGGLRLARTGTTGTAAVLHLVCLSKTYALAGAADRADAIAAEALVIAEEVQRPYDLAYARVAEGFHHYMLDDHDAAIAAFEIGLGVARESGIMLLVGSIARYLGHCYAAIGRPESALALLEEALAQAASHGLVAFRAWCELGMAHALPPEQALARFATAMDLAARHGYRPVEVYAAHMLGVLTPGAAGEARLRHARQLALQLGLRPYVARVEATCQQRGV